MFEVVTVAGDAHPRDVGVLHRGHSGWFYAEVHDTDRGGADWRRAAS
jgi:hypothetical protein